VQSLLDDVEALRKEARDLDAQSRLLDREVRTLTGAAISEIPKRFVQDSRLIEMMAKIEALEDQVADGGELVPAKRAALQDSLNNAIARSQEYLDGYRSRLANSRDLIQRESDILKRQIEQRELEVENLLESERRKAALQEEEARAAQAR
jgi:hypothetical protein